MDWTSDSDSDSVDDISTASDSDDNYKPEEDLSWSSDDSGAEETSGGDAVLEDDVSWSSDDGGAKLAGNEIAGIAGGDVAGPSRPSVIAHFVSMGFGEKEVERVVRDKGEENTEHILDTLLKNSNIKKSPSDNVESPVQSSSASYTCDDYSSDAGNSGGVREFSEDLSEKDWKLMTLAEMGFPVDAASSAIIRCGHNASILELADSIHAAGLAEGDGNLVSPSSSSYNESCVSSSPVRKKRRSEERTTCSRSFPRSNAEHKNRMCLLPKPMVGFGLPNVRPIITHRNIPDAAKGPPYFYYENVALTPKGAWETMSRFLYDIEPEFVDSQYFCAAARKRGYIHNLPIHNRFPLQPIPPRTIHEAFPYTKKWWPSWDPRTHLNCIQTSISTAKNLERIRNALLEGGNPPSATTLKYVVKECRSWNLLWIGPNKVAILEPDEMEMILGFPKDHTRGIGKTDRYKSLGNSFQVDTVAYHLSVLKEKFPNGIKVLSLFSGIGGAEVALHRLGIRLNVVVSSEISEVNQNVLRSWWEDTDQKGTLIELGDIQKINSYTLEKLMHKFGGFDLVIGGSPCNNLSGNNRVSRDGLDGCHSSLFYDYFRILDFVKRGMERKM